MNNIKIVIKKIKPRNMPLDNAKCYISENNIYYFKRGIKRIIYTFEENYYFIKNDIIKFDITENDNGYLFIYANFDLENVINSLNNKKFKKMFFSIMKIYYFNLVCDHRAHVILNLLEDTINNKNSVENFFINREMNIKNNYKILPNNIFILNNYFIDIENEIISLVIKKKTIKISGGIILNSNNYDWIDIIKLYLTSKTLIICEPNKCFIWKKKLKEIFNNINVIMKYKDYKSLSDNIDILIINNNCYNFNDIDLSNYKFKRLIVDNESLRKDIKYKFYNLKIKRRWLQINNIKDISNNSNMYYKYLSNNENGDNIIYKKNNIVLLNNLVKNIDIINDKGENVITENINYIKPNIIINDINNYVKENNLDNNDFLELVNILTRNVKSKYSYIKTNNKNNLRYLNNILSDRMKKCNICFKELNKNNSVITSCGHRFCLYCLLSSFDYNKKCPDCRKEIDYTDLYITSKKIMKEKFNRIIKEIKLKKKVVIFTSLLLIDFFSYYLNLYNIKNTKCKGRITDKLIIINEFNEFNKLNKINKRVIILDINDSKLLESIDDVYNIFFLNTPFNNKVSLNYYNDLHISHFIYENTIEIGY